jgi:protein O-mannosyl-transferase
LPNALKVFLPPSPLRYTPLVSRFFILLAALVLLTAGIYSSVHRFGFVDYDDGEYITSNPHIQGGLSLSDLKQAFTTSRVGNYAPLVSLSYCVDQSLFGLRPGPMHVENVLLHLLSGLLLWRLIFVSTGNLDRGFAVAALFLIHPMHVESVAWLAERKDVLSTPLLLGAMITYVAYTKPRSRARWFDYSLMLILFALSLLAKSMGVTLPAVLLLMDVWPLRRWGQTGEQARGLHGVINTGSLNWKSPVMEKIPLLALSIAASVMAGIAQNGRGATSSFADLGPFDRIANALVCYVIYIVKLAVPTKLAVFYQHPGARPMQVAIAAAGLLVVISYLFFRWRKNRSYLLIGWLWFLGTLIPVIGLVQIGSQAMADRYSYFPSIGLFIAVVWVVGEQLKNAKVKTAMLAIILAAYSFAAWRQVSYWKDSRSLFSHAAAVTDVNPVAYLVLARLDYQRGDLRAALDEFNRARNPFENARALDGMGNCVLNSDRVEAIALYRKAIFINANNALFHAHLANALWLDKKSDEAKHEAKTAIALDPEDADVRQAVNGIH